MPVRRCQASTEDTITHQVKLPVMCPVSSNPAPGSVLSLTYSPTDGLVLDVDDLASEVLSYVGGHLSGIRDMETTIQSLCAFAAVKVRSKVDACAELVILTSPETQQKLIIRCSRDPQNWD